MRLTKVLGAILTLFCSGAPVNAGPPYSVDDSETPEARHFEVNFVSATSRVAGGGAIQSGIEVNYGCADNLQLAIESGVDFFQESGYRSLTGMGDTDIELKWRFQEETKNRPQAAMEFTVKIPTASQSQGLGTGRSDHGTEIIMGKSFGRSTIFGNFGYERPGAPYELDNWHYGFLITNRLTNKLEGGVQVYGNTPDERGERNELAWGVGLTETLRPDMALLFQAGRSERGHSDLNVVVGVQLLFGSHNN